MQQQKLVDNQQVGSTTSKASYTSPINKIQIPGAFDYTDKSIS